MGSSGRAACPAAEGRRTEPLGRRPPHFALAHQLRNLAGRGRPS